MSMLDNLLGPFISIAGGAPLPKRSHLNFAAGVAAADNEDEDCTDITVYGTQPGGNACTLYVDATGGNDSTGQRGVYSLPFKTIQAALDAASSGDVVQVGPGTYSEAIVLPELAAISIVGAGMNNTIITSASATATVGGAPATTKLQTCTIAGLTVLNTGAGVAIGLSGAALASPGLFITGVLAMYDVRTISGDKCSVNCAANVILRDCSFGDLDFNECDNVQGFSTSVSGTCSASWDPGGTLPVGVGGAHRQVFLGCSVGTLTPKKLAQVEYWGKTQTITTWFEEDGANHGALKACGELGNVSINADSVAAVDSAVLDGAHMTSLTVSSTAGALRIAVSAKGANVDSAVTANALTDIDIRGGTYGSLVSAGAGADKGTVNRTTHVEMFEAVVGDTTASFAVPFTDAPDAMSFCMNGAGADPFRAALTATGYTITCAAALGVGQRAIFTHS